MVMVKFKMKAGTNIHVDSLAKRKLVWLKQREGIDVSGKGQLSLS